MELGCAMIFVKDFPRMREFYERLLQTPPINTKWTDSFALFDVGGAQLALHAIPEQAARGIQNSSPPKPREQGAVKLIYRVNDLAAERARLESMGVPLPRREWQNPEESSDAVDPEGNVFQITASALWRSGMGA
jgi:predicted enzyme related to lactoylglutathione lyase